MTKEYRQSIYCQNTKKIEKHVLKEFMELIKIAQCPCSYCACYSRENKIFLSSNFSTSTFSASEATSGIMDTQFANYELLLTGTMALCLLRSDVLSKQHLMTFVLHNKCSEL